jgi:hypothetical protein
LTSATKYVLDTFVPTQPTTPALNHGSHPIQDGAKPQAVPTRSAHLRNLVQAMIAFANTLVETLATPTRLAEHAVIARRFGTANIALITGRIARGLLMALALNRRLIRIARQLDKPTAARAAHHTPATRTQPRAPRHPVQRAPAIDSAADDAALLARLPTAEEIAERIRNRPIGRVIEDICRDLGILPSDLLWQQLELPIIINGGSLVRLFQQVSKRVICQRSCPMPAYPPQPRIATGPP